MRRRRDRGRREGDRTLPEPTPSFDDAYVALFHANFARMHRYLNRLSGDAELAADVVQEAFVRLHRRGELPDAPEAWLITVAMNLFRNERARSGRRARLMTPARGERAMADPPPLPDASADAAETRERVRAALDRIPERERQMLLLQAEGYAYRDIAAALELNEASVGTLLARARRAFKSAWEHADAS